MPKMTDDMKRELEERVRKALRQIPEFPKPGIVFQDITPVLADCGLFGDVITAMAAPFRGDKVTHVLGIEARGFIVGAAVARELHAGFVPARKPGKLPWESLRESYALEYGEDALEAHRDSCGDEARVLVVDDVLATGGTAHAAGNLARSLGATLVGWSFLVELAALNGRSRLEGGAFAAVARV